ncbi:PREDICTED: uncharacterized protein LOC105456635 [Wasmannia auropunctata]|uniref:uncharacterized protein LOC105456635 n=1 Tax=Wasmannia auropunctata TaxID=64793 RepID=UPI0005EE99C8|nr:PREDICTED: uncharacterized protein LOC105456635 [Wasmannia auropunctata]
MLFYAIVSAISVAVIGLSATEESTLRLPEFDFPSLDPLVYKYGKVLLNSDEIRGELIISNVTCIGISKAHFSDVRTHFLDDIFHLEIDVQIPKVFIKGATKINASLNIFKLVTEGYFNLTVENVRTIWDLKGHVVNNIWIIEHFLIAPSLGNFKVHYNCSIEEEREFYNIVIGFINEYWPPIYRAVLPFLSNVWEPFLIDIANKFFSKVSFSNVFP